MVVSTWIDFMKAEGIRWGTTSPRTSEQNGVAERLNRSIFDRVRTILIDTGLPLFLWAEAANYIVYVHNRHSTRELTNKTPYEQYFGTKPDLSRLHCFGCVRYLYNDHPNCNKLDPRGKQAAFVGYSDTQKAWRFYLPEKRTIQVSAHAKSDDDSDCWGRFLAEAYQSLKSHSCTDDEDLESSQPSIPSSQIRHLQPQAPPDGVEQQPVPAIQVPPVAPRATHAPRAPPRPPSARISQQTRNKITQSVQTLMRDSDDEVEEELLADTSGDVAEQVNLASGEEPRTHRQAMSSPDRAQWEQAMQEELDAISQLGTYQLTELSPGRNAIDIKWVFCIKRDTDGRITHCKARLVARGSLKSQASILMRHSPLL